jgi:hypothetical protein
MTTMNSKVLSGLFAVLLGLAGTGVAQAAADAEPGVARISVIRGNVSTQRGDSGDWVASTVNAPLVAGDRISVGDRSRAEIQLDFANLLRIDEHSEASLADISSARIQVQVARGLVNFAVLRGSEADIEIDTPNVAVHPRGEGTYRILVTADDETRVIVRNGEAEITTPQGSTTVHKNQMITIHGVESPQYQVVDAPGNDDWDNWNKDRDHAIQDAASWHHTNRYYTGAHDLDSYGRWASVDGYPSAVWIPSQGPGWAPYRDGRWVWEPYYGWTWVSYEPWGWAPYHYGRWFYSGDAWCWYPGPVIVNYRPIYAPAYVSFFGFGFGGRGRRFGFGFGSGFGSIGWLPIGPCDPFIPWYGGFRNRFNVVNVTNVTNITNITNINNGARPVAPLLASGRRPVVSNLNAALSNDRVRAGITTVAAENFGNGRVPRQQQAMNAAALRQGQLVAGNLPVVPTRASLKTTDREANPSTVRSGSANTQRFYSRGQQAPAPRSFNEDAAQLQRSIQQQQKTTQSVGVGTNPTTGNTGAPGGVGTRTGAPDTFRRDQGVSQTPPTNVGGNKNSTSQTQTTQPLSSVRPVNPSMGKTTQTPPPDTRPGWQRFGTGRAEGTSRPPAPSNTQPPVQTAPQRQGTSQPPAPQQQRQTVAPPPGGTRQTNTKPSGWTRFSESGNPGGPTSSTPTRPDMRRDLRSETPPVRTAPSGTSTTSRPPERQSGFQQFTPPPAQRSTERSNPPPQQRGSDRPPLELRKPIVTQRPTPPPQRSGNSGWGNGSQRTSQSPQMSGGYRGSSGGGYSSRPSYQSPSRSSSSGSGSGRSSSSGSRSSSGSSRSSSGGRRP